VDADATVISVKGGILPGEICRARREKAAGLSSVERRCERSAEVSRGHNRFEFDRSEGVVRRGTFISIVKEMPTKREEKPKFPG
jgi:ribosomal protein L44E